MPVIQIQSPSAMRRTGFALFELGFRPFFLLAGMFAVLGMAAWLLLYRAGAVVVPYYGFVSWHAHEMLFGYAAAVVAGFLLTAVKNWTGVQTIRYWPLALLVLLWLVGRLLPLIPGVPGWLVALTDGLFLPLLAVAIAHPIVKAKQWRNLFFVPLLLVYALGNLLYHLELLGITRNTLQAGTSLGVAMVLLLLSVMGGRVIGFFIERGLGGVPVKKWDWVEKAANTSVVVFFVAEALNLPPVVIAVLGVVTAVIHAVRMAGWYQHGVWTVSLLWVLFLGYGWMVVGFVLKALAALGLVWPFLALHAFTAGAIGVMTLGMMARVSLGHTGREMRAAKMISVAFSLIVIAAVVRGLMPIVLPMLYSAWIIVAGSLWVVAMVLFVIVYTPMLWTARVDGMPG